MAKAEKTTKIETVEEVKVIKREVTTPVVNLELTVEEAKVLMAILFRVGGEPEGPRGLSQNVCDALAEIVGTPSSTSRYGDHFWDEYTRKRGLYFEKGVTREQFVEIFDGHRARKFERDYRDF